MMEERPLVTVKAVHITPGEVNGRVAGSDGHRTVTIRVAPLEGTAWEGVISALATDPALVAAILDGELPATLVTAAGPRALEPSTRELRWKCGCGRAGELCAHVSAVWRAAVDELRRQPALILTLRGRDPAELASDASRLAALSTPDPDPGLDAAAAYECSKRGLPPPPEIQAPAVASRPVWMEPDILPRQRLLDQAVDAAGRALAILRETGDGCLELDRRSDVARIAASFTSPWDVSNLAWRAGMSPVELARLIRDWRVRVPHDRVAATGTGAAPITAATSAAGPVLEQLSLLDAQLDE